jgi:hypothetical protein
VGLTQFVRHLVVLFTGFLAGSRAIAAGQSWREWRHHLVQDPVSADAYRSYFLTDVAIAVLSLAIAGLVWWLLRPRDR